MHYSWIAGAALFAVIGVSFPAHAHAQVGLNVDVETRVREYFADTPVMIEIARCESKFRQYSDSGSALHGGAGAAMVGVYQIYSDIHADFAKSLGMDIYTLDGNLEYAKYLLSREGTQPWVSSIGCWGDAQDAALGTAPAGVFTLNLSLGMEHPQVTLLQQTLNAKGFRVADDGPGSFGHETQKFGALTRAAVRKFQCVTLHVCDGDEYSTGYGLVGPRTRTALVSGLPAKNTLPTEVPPADPPAPLYTPAQQEEIEQLQAQIAELTELLAELLAAQH